MTLKSSPPSALKMFLPSVQRWFTTALGKPTPAQEQGWPAIAAGEHTLILAPTGSGKTLAAFLACLDWLWRCESIPSGVQVLYISPLKALNNDIYRNLQVPLEGVTATAAEMGTPLANITAAVRTGDTPSAERQRLIRCPPHLLITTPESLHLMLTSKARETLGNIRYCIVDEIHSLCTNKRGVFLSLLLERLSALNREPFVRIGLSATQRPLDVVARYLGGGASLDQQHVPRPVTIIDAGLRKDLDLKVVSPVERFGPLPERSVWPSIYRLLHEQIRGHRSTIVFANHRRGVERITTELNTLAEEAGNEPIAKAHHGSVSLEMRRATEEALKEGRLPSVVATASLELGIDMGAVDLVCQVESTGNIARGLQRIGRAGHLVGEKSKGRLIPKTATDLLEQAVLAREMAAGHVEACQIPTNCMDILAQQIVAMVAMGPWPIQKLHDVIRQAWPYRDLTAAALDSVLEMISGRYRFAPVSDKDDAQVGDTPPSQTMNALQPRISWDRVHDQLLPLPGSQHLALVHGGTIPDTGQYGVYTTNGARIGELDEEFIYERRTGETIMLGTSSWRLEEIGTDRVIVTATEGTPALIPFWRGENPARSHELGHAIGHFLRDIGPRLANEDCHTWLIDNYHLDEAAARNLHYHVSRQLQKTGCLPTDKTILIEAFRDQLGDWQILLLSPLGSRLHLGLRLAMENGLRRRLGYRPQCLHHDDGLLIRLIDTEEPALDLLTGITAENVKDLVIQELSDSPLFALRFRHNAARALLLPSGGAGKRAPLWLQRLRGKDLLQVARRHPDFPIVVETYRECLQDYLDVPRLQALLADVESGAVEIVTHRAEVPSPFAADLLFLFNAVYMYAYDEREAGGQEQPLDRQLLDQLLTGYDQQRPLNPQAVERVDQRLRGLGHPPRSATEMAEWLRKLGDLALNEVTGSMPNFLEELTTDGRAVLFPMAGQDKRPLWILTEAEGHYQTAFQMTSANPDEQRRAGEEILLRFLNTHALVSLADILERYAFDADWARTTLEQWTQQGRLVATTTDAHPLQWSAPDNLQQIQRTTISILRREIQRVRSHQFVDYLCRWQKLHPKTQGDGPTSLHEVLDTLEGLLLSAELWESVVMASRLPDYQPRWLDDLLASGEWLWFGLHESDTDRKITFARRNSLAEFAPPLSATQVDLGDTTEAVLACLQNRGALFVSDIAQHTSNTPTLVRTALWQLLRLGLVTNDRFDVIRHGPPTTTPSSSRQVSLRRAPRTPVVPEGRWSVVPWTQPTMETHAVLSASRLLQRFGFATRELARLDPQLPAWQVLYEVYSRMELAGEVRRGYFVEGLSGAQFALPEAAQLLSQTPVVATSAPAILLHSLDPANLFGSGAPLEIPSTADATRSFSRCAGNWLVICAGRPVLLIEQHGRRLTPLPHAAPEQIKSAVGLLPSLARRDRTLASRHKISVRTWNDESIVVSEGKTLLEEVGFVRDYQDMTFFPAFGNHTT